MGSRKTKTLLLGALSTRQIACVDVGMDFMGSPMIFEKHTDGGWICDSPVLFPLLSFPYAGEGKFQQSSGAQLIGTGKYYYVMKCNKTQWRRT